MTNREFFNSIINGTSISAEQKAFAESAIVKLDASNARKKNTLSKTQVENLELMDTMLKAYVTATPQTASQIGEAMGLTTSKASALLRKLAENGEVSVSEVKSTAKSGGKVKAYALISEG